jgi:hypothetical protein
MSLSKYHKYLVKGSSIPNLYYSPIFNGLSEDHRLNNSNSVYCFVSEEDLINILEFDCPELIKIKSLVFLNELRRKFEKYRGSSDSLGRENGWVDLSRKKIYAFCGSRDSEDVKKLLISLGLIECDGLYSKSNGKSFSYRQLPRPYPPSAFFVKYTGKIVDFAKRYSFDDKITDKSGDFDIFDEEIKNNLKRASLRATPEQIAEKYPCKDFFATLGSLYDITNKQKYLWIDPKSGRRFHNFSSISRDARGAILLDNEDCSEVDYSACHPWLCLSFYEKGYEEEKELYLSALKFGFYKWFAEKIEHDISDNEKYSEFKISCIAQIFYDMPRHKNSKKVEKFAELFPHLYEIIDCEKNISNREFSIKLQNMEADLMYDGVFYKLISENIVGVPIHDSVVCKTKDAKNVKLIMEQEFFSKYNIMPLVNIKPLTF